MLFLRAYKIFIFVGVYCLSNLGVALFVRPGIYLGFFFFSFFFIFLFILYFAKFPNI